MHPVASIFYGLFLDSSSLCVASYAWKRVEPVLKAVDLIKARRAKGTLALSKGQEKAGFTTMPEEFVEMIIEQVVLVEVQEAENTLVRDLFHGWEGCGDPWCECGQDLELKHIHQCECCAEYFYEEGGASGMLKRSEQVRSSCLFRTFPTL
jgi:hypothetical protein